MSKLESRQLYLKTCSEWPDTGVTKWNALGRELAKLTCGKKADDDILIGSLEHMYQRFDCGDFFVIMLLRMLYMYPDSELISEVAREEIKKLFLQYDYWYGENNIFPGRQIYWTENHVMLYFTCEYLVTKLYPDEVFRFRGKKGSEISKEIYPKIIDWIEMKLRVGFSEWDSRLYCEENLASLLAIYDFSNDETLERKAKALIDVMTFSIAVNSYDRCYCASQGRAYPDSIIDEDKLLQCLMWDEFEEKHVAESLLKDPCVAFATSKYELNPLIKRIGNDKTLMIEDFEQQSFDVEDAPLFGRGYETDEDMELFWHNMAYAHKLVLDRMIEMNLKHSISVNGKMWDEYYYRKKCKRNNVVPRDPITHNYMGRVNKMVYKTPEYLLSCAQDFRKGERGYQQHIWQASLGDGAMVFTNHPGTLGIRDGRPDFWAGNDIMPKAVQYKDTVICMYDIEEECEIPYMHAYFPHEKFDEVCEIRNWIFARKADGYVALYSQNGYKWSTKEKWLHKEVLCTARKNVWICQMGRKEEYGDFTNFVAQIITDCIPECETLCVNYRNPRGEVLTMSWEKTIEVNGQEFPTRNYDRFNNTLCKSEYLSGEYQISYNGETVKISIN